MRKWLVLFCAIPGLALADSNTLSLARVGDHAVILLSTPGDKRAIDATITPDGFIAVPPAGRFLAVGNTTAKLEDQILQAFSKLSDNSITGVRVVFVAAGNSLKIAGMPVIETGKGAKHESPGPGDHLVPGERQIILEASK